MFKAISRPRSAVDSCADALQLAILDGTLSPGERLPPERKLAEAFGVNRVTLRSALTRLAAARLLNVRQGSGYMVQDFRARGGPELLPGLARLCATTGDLVRLVDDLLLVRRQLAVAVLTRLRSNVGGDRAAIRRAIAAFAATARAGGDLDALARADMNVLKALLVATGSEVLQLCFNPVLDVVGAVEPLRAAIYTDPPSNVRGYELLLAWLDADEPAGIDVLIKVIEARDRATLDRIRSPS